VVRGSGSRKQQRVRPKNLEDCTCLGAIALAKRDLGPFAAEQKRSLTVRVAIRPLLKDLGV
jgi:hypothetical protein